MATIVKVISDAISLTEHVLGHTSTGDRVTQVFESARDGLASRAELLSGGRISMSLRGAAPQGEEDTLRAARILIAMLNASGGDWLEPELANGAADFESRSRADPHLVFRGQVVRAIATSRFWKRLAQASTAAGSWTISELVAEIRQAINRKANKYDPADCSALHLVLDANRLPAMALTELREAACCSLAHELRECPFKAIWVVGRAPSFSFALRKREEQRHPGEQ